MHITRNLTQPRNRNHPRALPTLCAVLLSAPAAFAQGPLTPPGAPAATMKSLDQIHAAAVAAEPRIPIATAPRMITQSGSYYLTNDLNCNLPGTNGITVATSDVTIDLMGFSIRNGAAVAGSGIFQFAGCHGLSLRNGAVEGWGTAGQAGVLAQGSDVHVLDLQVSRNYNGIRVGADSRIERCEATANLGVGLIADRGAMLRASTVSGNTINGISVGPGSLVENVVILANGHGMYTQQGSLVRGCTITSNVTDGVYMMGGGQIIDCVADGNGEDGIELGNDCVARHNHCVANGRTGINLLVSGNTLDGNTVVRNGTNPFYNQPPQTPSPYAGIRAGAMRNLIIRNWLSNNQGFDLNVVAGNQVGTVMPPPLPTAPLVQGSTGGGFGATDPFANVCY